MIMCGCGCLVSLPYTPWIAVPRPLLPVALWGGTHCAPASNLNYQKDVLAKKKLTFTTPEGSARPQNLTPPGSEVLGRFLIKMFFDHNTHIRAHSMRRTKTYRD